MISRSTHAFLLTAILLSGCSKPITAEVSGRVTVDGKAVTGGTIVFSPVGSDTNPNPGNPGTADLAADGSYSFKVQAGANGLAPKFIVYFSPPQVKSSSKALAETPYQGLTPSKKEVELTPGSNVVNVELVPVAR